jgi:hypothetical protein
VLDLPAVTTRSVYCYFQVEVSDMAQLWCVL